MRRIANVRASSLAFALWACLALATEPAVAQTPRPYRLALLAQSDISLKWFRQLTLPELERLGFSAGNLALEERAGDADQQRHLARQLVATKPDVILAIGTNAVAAAREATTSVPIVMSGIDPVVLGLATSLSRPGGNVTGVAVFATELDAKRLELLHEALPAARKVGVLIDASSAAKDAAARELSAVAARLGLDLTFEEVAQREEHAAVLRRFADAGIRAVVIQTSPNFAGDIVLIARLALEAGLPSICQWGFMAKEGCFIGYGPDRSVLYRGLAGYVARILRGERPGDIPIERPDKFEFVINLKTAKALGLDVPSLLLARADELIE